MKSATHQSASPRQQHRSSIAGLALVAITAASLVVAAPAGATEKGSDWKNENKAFVQRDGSSLTLDGEQFRASGTNIYWLGLDENVGGVDYPTFFRIKDALDTAAVMGITVVRSHMTTSTSQDNADPLALMPKLGQYNDEAFRTIDFAVAYAGTLGIRLVLPLTDEWEYYHGGHRDFTTPLGLNADQFYSDPSAIAAYQDYVDHILTHTNSITGTRFVDDPTIMAWELGNELEGMTLDWINSQVAHIKDRAPQQLVAAGRRFDIDPDTLAAPDLDIVDVHYYPPTAERVSADAAVVAAAGKIYIAGEYASTAATGELLDAAAADPNVSGMFFWSLFGNNDRGGQVQHDDGFTLHYPGDLERAKENVAAIQHYSAATGSEPGRLKVGIPLITTIDQNYGINVVAWRGTAGAAGYIVQRSTDGGKWADVTDGPVSASASPVTDYESPDGAAYRVIPVDANDRRRTASDAVAAPNEGAVLVDPLESWSLTSTHDGTDILATPAGGVAAGTKGGTASITWESDGLLSATFKVTDSKSVVVSTSVDGVNWTDVPTKNVVRAGHRFVIANGLSGDAVRLSWKGNGKVERATITSAAVTIALFDPLNDFSKTAQHNGNLSFDSSNPTSFGGDTSRVKRDSSNLASLSWAFDDISGADIDAWYWPDQAVAALTVEGSADGSTWTTLQTQTRAGVGNWKPYTYSVEDLTGVNHLRVSWPQFAGEIWTPQIGSVSIYSPNAAPLTAPGAVELGTPAAAAASVTATPAFSWESAVSAAYYRFELWKTNAPGTPVTSATGLTATGYRPALELDPETTYSWQVTAVNGAGSTASERRDFFTAALPTEPTVVDDFDDYAADSDLQAAYVRNSGGGAINLSLTANDANGTRAAQFDYDLGTAGYAGTVKTFSGAQNWWGYSGLTLNIDADVSNSLSVQFVANGAYWEASVTPLTNGPQTVNIPFTDFAPPSWAPQADLDLTSVTQFALYINGTGTGTMTIDDITTVVVAH
ncbi:carbohydrate binding domain-containing protein [Cryobacterium sp. Sr3]|uniref:carbohydrate binding domain-containing protein n=1 Tax=Cryobacterium sp. Sr3 TaxID=1259194 RepID=UPI00106C52CA|nr:carbohydrate binding domain-containing protein [Cryobacterium sp. Sr3]TFB58310.1 hypothetical protein E3N94_04465 [Cryobacterium sp. Sr3]